MFFLILNSILLLFFDKKFFILYIKKDIMYIYLLFNIFFFFLFLFLSFFLEKFILENIFYFIFYFLIYYLLFFIFYIFKVPKYLNKIFFFKNFYLICLFLFSFSHILFFYFFFFNLKFLLFKYCLYLIFLTSIIFILNFFQIFKINFLNFQLPIYREWLKNLVAPQDAEQNFNLEINNSNIFSFLSFFLFLLYIPLILKNIKYILFFNFNFIYFIIYPIILLLFINSFSIFMDILLTRFNLKRRFRMLNKICLIFLFLIFWSFIFLIILLIFKDFSYDYFIIYNIFFMFIYLIIAFIFIILFYTYFFPYWRPYQIFFSFYFFIKITILNSFNFSVFFFFFNIFLLFFNIFVFFLFFYKRYFFVKNKVFIKLYNYNYKLFIIKPHVNYYLDNNLSYVVLWWKWLNKVFYISPWFFKKIWDQELHVYSVLYERHEMLNLIELFFPYTNKWSNLYLFAFIDTTCKHAEFCFKFSIHNLLIVISRLRAYRLIYKTLIVNQIKQLKIFYSKKNKKLNFKTIKLIKICKKLIYKTVQKLIFINKKIEKSIIFIKKNLNLYLTKRIKSGFKMYRQELKLLKFHQKLRLFCENNFKFYKKFLRNLGFRYSIDLFFYYKFEKGGIVLDGPSPRFRTYKRKGLIISIWKMYRRYQGFPDLKTLPKYDNYNDEKIEDAKLKEALKKRKKSLKNLWS